MVAVEVCDATIFTLLSVAMQKILTTKMLVTTLNKRVKILAAFKY
jgi:hypothetical protein